MIGDTVQGILGLPLNLAIERLEASGEQMQNWRIEHTVSVRSHAPLDVPRTTRVVRVRDHCLTVADFADIVQEDKTCRCQPSSET